MLFLPKLKLALLGALWFAVVAGLCFALFIAALPFLTPQTVSQAGGEVFIGLWFFGPSAAVAGFLLANRAVTADVIAGFFLGLLVVVLTCILTSFFWVLMAGRLHSPLVVAQDVFCGAFFLLLIDFLLFRGVPFVAGGFAMLAFRGFALSRMDFDEWSERKNPDRLSMPRNTLGLAMKLPSNYRWHMGKHGDDPTMQMVGSFFVTNGAAVLVRISQVELRYGLFGRHRASGVVMVANDGSARLDGVCDIPPGGTRDISFDFWISPPAAEAGTDFTAHSVMVIDQFGNRRSAKGVRFSFDAVMVWEE
jgi:hypothetical protein